MKWGRKKPAPSSPASIITRVLPVSWLSKFKRKGGNSETGSAKNCKRSGRYLPTNASVPGGWKEGRFYSMDEEDAYWRLSFSQEKFQARRSTGGINPLWYDYDHEFGVPISSFKGLSLREMDVPRREECRSYNDMVSDIKKKKQREGKLKTTHEGAFRSKHTIGEIELTATRQKCQNPRKLIRRVSREKQAELERVADNGEHMLSNSWERDVFPIEPEEMVPMKKDAWKLARSNSRKLFQIPNSHLSSAKEEPLIGEGSSATPDKNVSVSEWQDLENGKLKEIKVKPDHQSQKKSACTSRESHAGASGGGQNRL